MTAFPRPMQKLIEELSKLPSIGEKSAARLAYYLVNNNKKLGETISAAILGAVQTIKLCEKCFHLSDETLCAVCKNTGRDSALVCVVEKPIDVIAFERMGEFRGVYHVLHGLWAPLKGQGPEKMKLAELIERVKCDGVREIILATGSTVEGDATALYIAKALSSHGVKSTRLAQGLPKGGELEYADDLTLSRALQGRSVVG